MAGVPETPAPIMRFVDGFTAGTIVLATNHMGRYSDFEVSLEALQAPHGTQLIRARSGSSAYNQNAGVRQRTGDWVWFIDDDHTFAPDVLMRLLAHDKDIVAPLVPMRCAPYALVLYKQLDIHENEHRIVDAFTEAFYDYADLNGISGLYSVQGLPKAGCLIKERVWTDLKDPWFRIGLIHPDCIEDDKYFMWEVREKLGYTLWCDTDQTINHLTTASIECARNSDGTYKRVVRI